MDNIHIKSFAYLYSKDNIFTKGLLTVMIPYYKFKHYLLSIKDKIDTYKIMNGFKAKNIEENLKVKNFDWTEEKKKVTSEAKSLTTNNDFGILNDYYDTYVKEKISGLKGAYKDVSYTKSPEYDDFKYLLDTCKSIGVKPLFVSVPVHGKWYDYCGFSKEDRSEYYKKINKMVTSYGFEILDLSKYEHEDYVLQDIMHLGWKGWLYFDEAIVKYYNNN
ncbi:D-alanyl-lipoteichoic acid biosynthesis protein DltD [Clostridium sporogenes]